MYQWGIASHFPRTTAMSFASGSQPPNSLPEPVRDVGDVDEDLVVEPRAGAVQVEDVVAAAARDVRRDRGRQVRASRRSRPRPCTCAFRRTPSRRRRSTCRSRGRSASSGRPSARALLRDALRVNTIGAAIAAAPVASAPFRNSRRPSPPAWFFLRSFMASPLLEPTGRGRLPLWTFDFARNRMTTVSARRRRKFARPRNRFPRLLARRWCSLRVQPRGGAMGSGMTVHGAPPADAARVLTPEALEFVATLSRRFERTRSDLLRRRARQQADFDAGELPGLPSGDGGRRGGRLEGRRDAAGPPEALGRDHRARRAQDDDQRAQLGRRRLHGRLRGLPLADLGQRRRRPGQPDRRRAPGDRARAARRKILPAEPDDRDAARPAARLAPVREARHRRRRAGLRQPLRFRPLLLPQRARAPRPRHGPYFYLPKMESHLEARLWNDVFLYAQDALGSRAGPSARRS